MQLKLSVKISKFGFEIENTKKEYFCETIIQLRMLATVTRGWVSTMTRSTF